MRGHRDPAWFEALYRAHYQQVLQYARRRVSAAEADDVVAEVFATAWRRRDEVAEIGAAWLLRTASNHVLHVHRGVGRRARLARRLANSASEVLASWSEQGGAAEQLAVTAAMQALSVEDQELLRLSAWEQLPTAELAVVIGCSTAAVRVRLHRARRRLAARLAEQGTSTPTSTPEVKR